MKKAMYLIDRRSNRLTRLIQRTFSELNFREREHLQEWIANSPECLGEELVIIQKEFSGFLDTNERLDLLALDKQGNIVVIENKLDDAGRDVTWQVLKYASYCSTLTKEQIRKIYQYYLDKQRNGEDAEQNLIDFYGVSDFAEINLNSGLTQRIMMIAGNFRKEVTSTVLWLINYKMRIQCFRAMPFQLGDELILNVEQVIPMKDAEEFTISMAEKTQEDISDQEEIKSRHILRLEFWREFLRQANERGITAFQNRSPGKDSWLSAASGMSGVVLNSVISKKYARVEVYISRGDREENKFVFDQLFERRHKIEDAFGNQLVWERLDEKKDARIKFSVDANYFDRDDWPATIDFLLTNFLKLERAFREQIGEVNNLIKSRHFDSV
jgi:hypothetical protein